MPLPDIGCCELCVHVCARVSVCYTCALYSCVLVAGTCTVTSASFTCVHSGNFNFL